MDGHYKLIFKSNQRQLLLGMLTAFDFKAFEETADGLEAWLPSGTPFDVYLSEITSTLAHLYDSVEPVYIGDQNWNVLWESRFEPVVVGDFCQVRAPFHEASEEAKHDILLRPEMAFGTGHHDTTYMILAHLAEIGMKGKSVLDLGCGTGVLSIASLLEGAKKVVAVDVESQAVDSTLVNLVLNGVSADVRLGSIEVVEDEEFDVILANINRNALMFLMPTIVLCTSAGGRIILSGFLEENRHEMIAAAEQEGFTLSHAQQRADWLCLEFKRL